MNDIAEAEVIEIEQTTSAIVQRADMNLLGARTGRELIALAQERAEALADVIRQKDLTTNISGREHVRLEGWTLCGSMLGVFPVITWTKPVTHDGHIIGYEARCEARTLSGAVVGAAEAMCTEDETNWKGRDEFALRSMAQTRAASKALRLPLGFVMTLAGYAETPAEEMDGVQQQPSPSGARRRQPAEPSASPRPSGAGSGKASEKQIKAVWAIAASKGVRDHLRELVQTKYGCGVDDLTGGREGTASACIDWLSAETPERLQASAREWANEPPLEAPPL